MPSQLYPLGKEAILNGDIDIDTDTIKVRAVADEDYTYSAAHQFISSVTGYAGTTDPTLASVTKTSGTVDAADLAPAFAALSQSLSKDIDGLVIYKDTGVAGTSPLIAYFDLAAALTPNGGDVNITWNASGIFAI